MSTFAFWWGMGIFSLALSVYSYIFVRAFKSAKGHLFFRIMFAAMLPAVNLVFVFGMVTIYKVYMGLV